MAIFNEINKHSKVVGIVIGAGLLLFMLGNEFFGQNSIFSRSKNDIGEIAGNSIARDLYQQRLAESEQDYIIRTGKSPGENERVSVQEMAWNKLISQYVVEPQYDALGLAVTDDELVDMVQGKNINPTVKQLFTNPQTQQFDVSFLKNFLSNLDKQEPRNQQLWFNIENSLKPERLRAKYTNLLKLTNYVTKEEAKREYTNQTAKEDVKFVFVPYMSIVDSTVAISDDDIKQYIGEHKSQYEVEEGRSIEYIAINVVPSAKDSADVKAELAELTAEFKTTDNDSLFVSNNSDSPAPLSYKGIGELPENLKSSSLVVDSVYGPYEQNGKYTLYKITGSKNDSLYSARASHILFKAAPTATPEELKAVELTANSILDKLKQGAPFDELAKAFGSDGTASRGGDLGWFTQGQMVKPFNDAVMNASSKGLLPKLVKTDFGYHIIKVTETKTNKKYQVAVVEREITPSEETKDLAFKKADDFAAANKDSADFHSSLANDKTLTKMLANNFKKTDRYVGSLNNPRELVRWAYDEASVGDVSKVFSIGEQYIVATLTGERDKGLASVEDVKQEVTAKLLNEKKAAIITEKLNALGNLPLDQLATKYANGAQYNTANELTYAASSIPGLGYDPISVGKAFGVSKGKRTAPFKGESGVTIIEVVNFTAAPEIADYSAYKNQLLQQRSGREDYVIDEVLKKKANIEDNRYKFF